MQALNHYETIRALLITEKHVLTFNRNFFLIALTYNFSTFHVHVDVSMAINSLQTVFHLSDPFHVGYKLREVRQLLIQMLDHQG